jgi:hypothetical protein
MYLDFAVRYVVATFLQTYAHFSSLHYCWLLHWRSSHRFCCQNKRIYRTHLTHRCILSSPFSSFHIILHITRFAFSTSKTKFFYVSQRRSIVPHPCSIQTHSPSVHNTAHTDTSIFTPLAHICPYFGFAVCQSPTHVHTCTSTNH